MSDQATTPKPKAETTFGTAPAAPAAVVTGEVQGDPNDLVAMQHPEVEGYAITTREGLAVAHTRNGWTEVSTADLYAEAVELVGPGAVSETSGAEDLVEIIKTARQTQEA